MRLRVATYNVHGWVETAIGTYRRVLAVLRQIDANIIALQGGKRLRIRLGERHRDLRQVTIGSGPISESRPVIQVTASIATRLAMTSPLP